jgi:hypothetical protein
MDSAGHRENILGPAWDHIGVGAYKGPTGKKMWTVLFADKCGSTAPKPTAKSTPKPKSVVRATPRPTPKPTPKPARAPAAVATPAPTLDVLISPNATPILGPDAPSPAITPDTEPSPSPDPGDDTEGDGTVGMRVVDEGRTDGLLQSIVGGVTGLFFGG